MNKCQICNKETNNPKFCSLSCSAKYGKSIQIKKVKHWNKCINCQKETLNLKFCSRNCSAIYNGRKYPKRTAIIRYCLYCSNKLVKGEDKYCNRECLRNYNYKNFIEKWLRNEISGNNGIKSFSISDYVRRWIFEKNQNKCEKCGWSKINLYTNTIPLEVHHKDGNWENTVPDNLELLCPNCHSLTPSKGRGRPYRKKK